MKDRIYLLSIALLFAADAWLFWSGARQWGFVILQVLVCGVLIMNRIRFRKQLRERLMKAMLVVRAKDKEEGARWNQPQQPERPARC